MANVTIIGAGNMARGIATRLLAGGAELQILAPTAEHATSLAEELGGGGGAVTGAGVEEPLAGEIVVLATRAIDTGPLRRARQLEQLGFLHMALQDKLGSGFGSAIKIITP